MFDKSSEIQCINCSDNQVFLCYVRIVIFITALYAISSDDSELLAISNNRPQDNTKRTTSDCWIFKPRWYSRFFQKSYRKKIFSEAFYGGNLLSLKLDSWSRWKIISYFEKFDTFDHFVMHWLSWIFVLQYRCKRWGFITIMNLHGLFARLWFVAFKVIDPNNRLNQRFSTWLHPRKVERMLTTIVNLIYLQAGLPWQTTTTFTEKAQVHEVVIETEGFTRHKNYNSVIFVCRFPCSWLRQSRVRLGRENNISHRFIQIYYPATEIRTFRGSLLREFHFLWRSSILSRRFYQKGDKRSWRSQVFSSHRPGKFDYCFCNP